MKQIDPENAGKIWVPGQGPRAIVMALAFAALLACLGLLFDRVRNVESNIAQSVNSAMWSVAQLEFEYLRFLNDLDSYYEDAGHVSKEVLLERFEILWSRVDVLLVGPEVKPLRARLDLPTRLEPILTTLQAVEPQLSALQPGMKVPYLEIKHAVEGHGPDLHDIVVEAHWFEDWQDIYRAEQGSVYHQENRYLFAGAMVAAAILILLLLYEFRVAGRLLRQSVLTEQKLLQARNTAEDANRAKSRFLAAANHDLRQPLQALTMLLAVLQKTTDWHHRQLYYAQISGKLEAMGHLLNVLLDINNLDEGQVEVKPQDLALDELFERIKSEFGLPAQEAGLELRFVRSRLIIRSDPVLIERVVANLVSNAIRYTGEGKVLIGCRRHGASARIEVWDTGPGLSSEQIDSIFQDYVQLDNPSRDPNKGLGLGLAIVERLAQLLEHKVEVRSTPGKGSVFTIEVPAIGRIYRSQTRPKVASEDLGSLHRRTILMIEDNAAMLDTTAHLLEIWGARVIKAETGDSALAQLAEGRSPLDLIVADYRLTKGPNGLQSIAIIRDTLGRRVPAIVMTGDTGSEVTRKILASGCALAHKPFQPDDFKNLMVQLINEAEAPQAKPQSAAPESGQEPRIVAAND